MHVSEADCVVALSFGKATSKTNTDMNKAIAAYARSCGLPILAQEEVAQYIPNPFFVIKRSDGYLDTWSVLSNAKAEMERNGFKRALFVAHAAHSKRAGGQATKLRLSFTIPDDLPQVWDAHSEQWWTRSRLLWTYHELYTVPKQRLLKHL